MANEVTSKPSSLAHSEDGTPPPTQKASFIDSLPETSQFVILSFLMFLFFGAHNVLQEAMTALPGFEYGVMLGYMEVIG